MTTRTPEPPVAPPETDDRTGDLTIDDLSELDPRFEAKFEDAFKDVWVEILRDMFFGRSKYHHTASTQPIERKVEKMLDDAIRDREPWVQEWEREQKEGLES